MNDQYESKAISGKSMRIGIDSIDEQKKYLAGLIELLDRDATHFNTNEEFMRRFHVLQVEIQKCFAREENMMGLMQLPELVKANHKQEHDEIVAMFVEISIGSMNDIEKKTLEIYQQVRSSIAFHFLKCDRVFVNYIESLKS